MTPDHDGVSRRALVRGLMAAPAVWAAPALWAQSRSGGHRSTAGRDGQDGRLVVVFLRGAYDGLSALVPYGDRHYYAGRPNIAIAPPDGTQQTTLALDAMFGLHPAFAPLMPLWKQGVLAALPTAGSPHATRSHFEAQYHWETGAVGERSARPGWLNTLAGLRMQAQGAAAPGASDGAGRQRASGAVPVQGIAMGIGEANPQILSGTAPVQLVPKGQAATRQGALGNGRTRDAVMGLYAGNDELSRMFRQGADSRMQTADTLNQEAMQTPDEPALNTAKMVAANNGAGSVRGLLLDVQHLSTLMRQNQHLRLGFVSAGGWDTHANQGNATGLLARSLGDLAAALVQLRAAFSQPNDVVLVCSEFGRTAQENGTRGTDHGHGNTLWVMGNQVQGGRWHGQWDGLAPDQLHEQRDLPVHHDFRAVLAQVLRVNQGLDAAQLQALFPGVAWDKRLDGLMRA